MRLWLQSVTVVNTTDYKRSFIAEKLQKDDFHYKVKAQEEVDPA